MRRYWLIGLGLAFAGTAAQAADPETCKPVRFSDVGWTDITATTAIASLVDAGVLSESSGRKRDRSFRYAAYLALLGAGTEV